ncbi:hypothetical protein LEN26_001361 [Aphanomyces euteiches]|nr:hypothetical protein AeMF1_003842 [Aphanomyces euteiches]KAH9161539.1 hypothetical protein LEN26_001361 [Aphanomyces euteiches]KAH9187491.1 hypothetical protein AeNC1_010536 [Aphanomyces euteiches]
MVQIRALFDGLIEEYPVMSEYLTQNSQIVQCPDFENAAVKIQSGIPLEKYEILSVERLRAQAVNESEDTEHEYAKRLVKKYCIIFYLTWLHAFNEVLNPDNLIAFNFGTGLCVILVGALPVLFGPSPYLLLDTDTLFLPYACCNSLFSLIWGVVMD